MKKQFVVAMVAIMMVSVLASAIPISNSLGTGSSNTSDQIDLDADKRQIQESLENAMASFEKIQSPLGQPSVVRSTVFGETPETEIVFLSGTLETTNQTIENLIYLLEIVGDWDLGLISDKEVLAQSMAVYSLQERSNQKFGNLPTPPKYDVLKFYTSRSLFYLSEAIWGIGKYAETDNLEYLTEATDNLDRVIDYMEKATQELEGLS